MALAGVAYICGNTICSDYKDNIVYDKEIKCDKCGYWRTPVKINLETLSMGDFSMGLKIHSNYIER